MPQLNLYALDLISKYLSTKFVEVPKRKYSIAPEHFYNFALLHGIEKIKFIKGGIGEKYELFSSARMDKSTIEHVVEIFEREARMFFIETDTTCYSWEYSSAMSQVARQVKEFFIRRPK